jgi:hypothetical protein
MNQNKSKNIQKNFLKIKIQVQLWFNEKYEKDKDNKISSSNMLKKFNEDNYENNMNATTFGKNVEGML